MSAKQLVWPAIIIGAIFLLSYGDADAGEDEWVAGVGGEAVRQIHAQVDKVPQDVGGGTLTKTTTVGSTGLYKATKKLSRKCNPYGGGCF
jgi:hypothetical protein